MSIEVWILFVVVSLAPAFSPGPAIILAIANTVQFGAVAAFWSSLGNALGMFLLGLAVTLGLGGILALSVPIFFTLKTIAILYLVWLGIKIFRDRTELEFSTEAMIPRKRIFGRAFLVSVTNPKAVMLFIALLPGFISAEGSVLLQGIILSATFAGVTVLSHRCYALVFGKWREFLTSARRIRWVRRVLGGSLIGFGLSLSAFNR